MDLFACIVRIHPRTVSFVLFRITILMLCTLVGYNPRCLCVETESPDLVVVSEGKPDLVIGNA
jgi:hypothetical protein